MKKLLKLSHITLDPSQLFGAVDAVATKGKVHAMVIPVLQHEGEEFASTDPNVTPDALIGVPAIATAARMLFEAVAQELANASGTELQYLVRGEIHTVTPTK